ncbi:MAG: hypothetical protein M1826_002993 [Phylliscum demangeonii]|nr:MAG: hypothetical protein M1826_002993 [Phylliscum demangeonii]
MASADASDDKFGYLDKWRYIDEDVELPPLGESGSDGGYDSDTLDAIEKENADHAAKKKKPTMDRAVVVAEIERTFEKLTAKWNRTQRAKHEFRARKMWDKATVADARLDQIIRFQEKVDTINQKRLPKLLEEIAGMPWDSLPLLRKQCKVAEPSVYEREKMLYNISVLKSIYRPEGPSPQEMQVARKEHKGRSRRLANRPEDDDDLLSEIIGAESEGDGQSVAGHLANKEVPGQPEGEGAEVEVVAGRSDHSEGEGLFVTPGPDERPYDPKVLNPLTSALEEAAEELPETANPFEPLQLSRPEGVGQSREAGTLNTPGADAFVIPDDDGASTGDGDRASNGDLLGAYRDVDLVCSRPSEYYEEHQDRKRLLITVLANIVEWVTRDMASRLPGFSEDAFRNEVFDSLRALKQGRDRLPGYSRQEMRAWSRLGLLYYTWWECKRLPSAAGGWRAQVIDQMLSKPSAFHAFNVFIRQALEKYAEPGQVRGLGEDQKERRQPRALRGVEDVAARDVRVHDRQRLQDQEERKRQLQLKYGTISAGITGDPSRIIINAGKLEEQPPIYIDPHIGRKIKEHQIVGVQFLWREIVMDTVSRQGCLLAHDMGLGKTMQVITLLVTIAQAAKSSRRAIAEQIPEDLKRLQTLILCPPTLVGNWRDEILLWAPTGSVGNLRLIESGNANVEHRLQELALWNEEGGVLIMGYSIFRDLVVNKARGQRSAPLDEVQYRKAMQYLLEGANIVVADEAHQLKNAASELATAASQFKTKSRIALTASPLNNNTGEYYHMVNWIAPGYLGPQSEFNEKYKTPIEIGFFQDSDRLEHRQALTALRALTSDLEPKVCRASISVLKESLPSKTEFILTVNLARLQLQAYKACLVHVAAVDQKVTRLWNWLMVLGLVCGHPMCLMDTLTEQEKKARNEVKGKGRNPGPPGESGASLSQSRTTTPDLDEEIDELPGSDDLIEKMRAVIGAVDGKSKRGVEHSYKMSVLEQILEGAREAGDRTLIFSHRIAILDFVENVLKRAKWRYARLDGQTRMGSRLQETKDFNAGGSDVYLISTKAGAVGINLPGANRVIILDSSYNPAWEQQAVGRSYRLGQLKPVFVYFFVVGGTFEEVMDNISVFKRQLAVRVVDRQNLMRHAQKHHRKYLFEPTTVEKQDLSKYVGKDPLVLDKILARGNHPICKIQLMDSFHEPEDGTLTAEENARVGQLLQEEQVRRSDPEAYLLMQAQRAAEGRYSSHRVDESRGPLWSGRHSSLGTQPTPLSGDGLRAHAMGGAPPETGYHATWPRPKSARALTDVPMAMMPVLGANSQRGEKSRPDGPPTKFPCGPPDGDGDDASMDSTSFMLLDVPTMKERNRRKKKKRPTEGPFVGPIGRSSSDEDLASVLDTSASGGAGLGFADSTPGNGIGPTKNASGGA